MDNTHFFGYLCPNSIIELGPKPTEYMNSLSKHQEGIMLQVGFGSERTEG